MIDESKEHLLQTLRCGLIKIDTELRITNFSREAAKMTGYSADDAIGMNCHELFLPNHCEEDCPAKKAIEGNLAILNSITQIKTKAGIKKSFLINAIPADEGVCLLLTDLDQIFKFNKNLIIPSSTCLAELEKILIEETLKKFNWNRIKTAEALGISRITLWRRMKQYNIKKK